MRWRNRSGGFIVNFYNIICCSIPANYGGIAKDTTCPFNLLLIRRAIVHQKSWTNERTSGNRSQTISRFPSTILTSSRIVRILPSPKTTFAMQQKRKNAKKCYCVFNDTLIRQISTEVEKWGRRRGDNKIEKLGIKVLFAKRKKLQHFMDFLIIILLKLALVLLTSSPVADPRSQGVVLSFIGDQKLELCGVSLAHSREVDRYLSFYIFYRQEILEECAT